MVGIIQNSINWCGVFAIGDHVCEAAHLFHKLCKEWKIMSSKISRNIPLSKCKIHLWQWLWSKASLTQTASHPSHMENEKRMYTFEITNQYIKWIALPSSISTFRGDVQWPGKSRTWKVKKCIIDMINRSWGTEARKMDSIMVLYFVSCCP